MGDGDPDRLTLQDDADRLISAVHVEDLALNSRVKVLRVVEADGAWLRSIVEDDSFTSWHRAG